jgi:uncharacterized protein YqjF (DUF2071 family)
MIRPTTAQRLAERERPAGLPVMRQRWARLLFLHWTWDPAAIQAALPPGLTVDLHEGKAWVGLVPFFMERVRPRGLPAVPGLSDVLELNVRTYVHDAQGRPGVWFYSLDANQWLAVKIARTLFHLPYEHAAMTAAVDAASGTVDYAARRLGVARESRFRYRATGPARLAQTGTAEFFLAERYRLFAWDARRGRLFTGQVHHQPYRLRAATVSAWDDGMMRLAGFDCDGLAPEHICAAEPVDVEVWPLQRVVEPVRMDIREADGLGGALPSPV